MSQPDDSEAIFALANRLAALPDTENQEIYLRSAVSRAYYAVFLLAREKMKVTATTDVHSEVIRQVRRFHRGGQLTADSLYELKEMRVAADYEFPAREDYQDWQQNWQIVARKARYLLDKFKTW